MQDQIRKTGMKQTLEPDAWGLEINSKGELTIAGCSAVDLAAEFGTPLHVVHDERLEETAVRFLRNAEAAYPGRVSVHYPFKSNSVPGVVQTIQRAGLKAEVMTDFELDLALRLGYREDEIIVNGPCKTDSFLENCVNLRVKLIIVDSIDELLALQRLTERMERDVDALLRINPNYVPDGMNSGSSTGSRKGCAFGLDLKGGDVRDAFSLLKEMPAVHFQGFHLHIGTGIRNPKDYANALDCIPSLVEQAQLDHQAVRIIDVGGGFASMTTREFTSCEMLRYQAFGRLPASEDGREGPEFLDFAREISSAITRAFPHGELPELIYEPGRCITSSNQLLLLTVHRVKNRRGIGKWLIADGGLSTVTIPTYYEYHEVFLANEVNRPRTERVTIIGPACFAGDIVYRNKCMPAVCSGEVLAIMDTGAYFTALESSFGFYRPAIVSVRQGAPRLIRCRELFGDAISRDRISVGDLIEEEAA
jgi:diaminopimelate decarboxylase